MSENGNTKTGNRCCASFGARELLCVHVCPRLPACAFGGRRQDQGTGTRAEQEREREIRRTREAELRAAVERESEKSSFKESRQQRVTAHNMETEESESRCGEHLLSLPRSSLLSRLASLLTRSCAATAPAPAPAPAAPVAHREPQPPTPPLVRPSSRRWKRDSCLRLVPSSRVQGTRARAALDPRSLTRPLVSSLTRNLCAQRSLSPLNPQPPASLLSLAFTLTLSTGERLSHYAMNASQRGGEGRHESCRHESCRRESELLVTAATRHT